MTGARRVAPGAPDLPEEVREVADALIAGLGDDLSALLWHGSWARGEAKPWSDHDMIIVLWRLDDELLCKLQGVFAGRKNWSTHVRTEQELRQYPSAGRPQFHFGLVPLYGGYQPPPLTREHVLDELRMLVLNVSFEARYRLLHREPLYADMERWEADFARRRTARMLRYAAKLAVLAMKARELVKGREYPVTADELRARLCDADELWLLDTVQSWDQVQHHYEAEPDPLALRLDAFARNLAAWLDSLPDA